jgi:hypothetical protein
MALKGTLADLGIIDLIQFPHGGRKSGELVITSKDGEGRLYYDNGALVHAAVGHFEGMSALVCMVDWAEGTFEFVNDTKPTRKTIELDLHRAVMHALKLHDELRAEEKRRKAEGLVEPKQKDEALLSRLSEFVSSNDFAVHACVISPEGTLKAAANGPDGAPRNVEKLRGVLHELLGSYPRENLSRAFAVDEQGTVVLVRLSDGSGLIVIAGKEASLGAVAMSVGRLATELA